MISRTIYFGQFWPCSTVPLFQCSNHIINSTWNINNLKVILEPGQFCLLFSQTLLLMELQLRLDLDFSSWELWTRKYTLSLKHILFLSTKNLYELLFFLFVTTWKSGKIKVIKRSEAYSLLRLCCMWQYLVGCSCVPLVSFPLQPCIHEHFINMKHWKHWF